jgi:hypothetical protein
LLQATGQVQSDSLVQEGLRHIPPEQTNPALQSLLLAQALSQLNGTGVGDGVFVGVFEGVFVGVTQIQSSLLVQEGLRHIPPEQTKPEAQSAFLLHEALQAPGGEVGVGVGETLSAKVILHSPGSCTLNVKVHAGVAALGSSGVIGLVCCKRKLVIRVTIPSPSVPIVSKLIYQYFRIIFIYYLQTPPMKSSASIVKVVVPLDGIVKLRMYSPASFFDDVSVNVPPLTLILALVALVPTTAMTILSPGCKLFGLTTWPFL